MIRLRVFEMLFNVIDFVYLMFKIDLQIRLFDIQIVFVLIYLLCVVIFKGEVGNCWYNIFMDLKKMELVYLFGNVSNEIKDIFIDCLKFYNYCNFRFVSDGLRCLKCYKECVCNVLC